MTICEGWAGDFVFLLFFVNALFSSKNPVVYSGCIYIYNINDL